MSADNYLLVVRDDSEWCSVYHLFASDEDVDIGNERPIFAGVRDEALRFAHTWAHDNVCEYGVRVAPDVWDAA